MPEQYPYPTDGWSTGKMRKKGDRMREGLEGDITEGARALGEQSPLIQSIEQMHQERMKMQGIPEKMRMPITNRSGVSGSEIRELESVKREKQRLSQAGQMSPEEFNKYWQSGSWEVIGKVHKVDPSKASPDGMVIEKDHPQIKELEDKGWESLTIPDEGWSKGHIFMKPPVKSPEVA